ncbi:MAG: DNA-3-methyladenine glycosylase 2 family protein [Pseudomonadales bacterium]|nr:DNA-3-methyladenine glycosylase 2 family protein [Pseudomonadales bacterium]NNL10346.1 DNA-3-methyladenine glycosylase 2 family protein [Pseudomonadales bacterium]
MQGLCECDEDIAKAHARIGAPAPRNRPQGFATLLQTIVSQQVSTAAAKTIFGRVEQALGELQPQQALRVGVQGLRDAGMSQRKAEYALGLAEAIIDGSFPVDSLQKLSLQDAVEQIARLRGFGQWSAEIYCMFSLRHQDVFPADDLALLTALQAMKKLHARPRAKEARALTEHWAPFRSTGALFLWHWYHDYRSGGDG